MMKPLIVIPARGGSKGIPRKNIKELAGKPLISYTLDVASDIAGKMSLPAGNILVSPTIMKSQPLLNPVVWPYPTDAPRNWQQTQQALAK